MKYIFTISLVSVVFSRHLKSDTIKARRYVDVFNVVLKISST